MGRRLDRYRKVLRMVFPNPVACDKGPARAIELGKLLDLHDFFCVFICDQSA